VGTAATRKEIFAFVLKAAHASVTDVVAVNKNTPYPVGKKVYLLKTGQHGWIVRVGRTGLLRVRIDETD
jgi:hypothetical protein